MTSISSSKSIPWLLSWFQQRNPGSLINVDTNYLSQALLDSFSFIELLSDIEIEFGFRIEFADLNNPEIHTIRGLATLISRRS